MGNPIRRFRIIILIFLFSLIYPSPVYPRPSAFENPSHSVSHETAEINSQPAEDDEQFLTEGEMPEDDFNLEEEYPQHDEPLEEYRRVVKPSNTHFIIPHHVNNGLKAISAQQGLAPPLETNDSVPETPEEEENDTYDGDNEDNSTAIDEEARVKNREMIKESRLNDIKALIENLRAGVFGGVPKPTKLPPPLDAYPMKRRSFHPSCSLPNNTDVEMWTDSNPMNLLFNLTYPAPQNTTVTIVAATLRLYKVAQGNRTSGEPSCGANVVPTAISNLGVNYLNEHQPESPIISDLGIPLLPSTSSVLQDDDKQIRVSIYWYTRSLKKNKVKRKLLDSRMLSVFGKDEWVEFNVRHATRQWRQLGKNFGLAVEVENEDGEVLKASEYFKIMNCSNEASTKPLPGVLLELLRRLIESNYNGGAGADITSLFGGGIYGDDLPTGIFNNSPFVYSFLFPVIDMCTVEIPTKEADNAAFLEQSRQILTQQLTSCKSKTENRTELHVPQGASAQETATDVNENETLVESQDNSDQNNISHAHGDTHKKERRHSSRHTNPQDSAHGNRLRHANHKHRSHNNNHFDEKSPKKHDNSQEEQSEREEIKEEITLTDDSGRQLREKIIFQEMIRSSTNRDSHPQRDSDR